MLRVREFFVRFDPRRNRRILWGLLAIPAVATLIIAFAMGDEQSEVARLTGVAAAEPSETPAVTSGATSRSVPEGCDETPWEAHRQHPEYVLLRSLPSPDRMLSVGYVLRYAAVGAGRANGNQIVGSIYANGSGHVLQIFAEFGVPPFDTNRVAESEVLALRTRLQLPESRRVMAGRPVTLGRSADAHSAWWVAEGSQVSITMRSSEESASAAPASHSFAERLLAEGLCGAELAVPSRDSRVEQTSVRGVGDSTVNRLTAILGEYRDALQFNRRSATSIYLTVLDFTSTCYEGYEGTPSLRTLAPGGCLRLIVPYAYTTAPLTETALDESGPSLLSSGNESDALQAIREAILAFDGARR